MDTDFCKHDQGYYIDDEDMIHDKVERCNLCDACINMTRAEYEDEPEDYEGYETNESDCFW